MKNLLITIWWYRPWHAVKVIYIEDDVIGAEWIGRVAPGILCCLLLCALHVGACWCGTAQGACSFVLVDAPRRQFRPLLSARILLLAAAAVLVWRRDFAGARQALRLLLTGIF